MSRMLLDNAKLVAFVAGLVLILTVERETLVLVYLAGGFLWFIVWLLAGEHTVVERDNRRAHARMIDLGPLSGKYSQPD
ncbi:MULTISPECIES: hypothetical protein [unclassified Epibacterium]|uniref:hypothetical protein n=1 Tax=unclassified Epibacterium TaxID=2639179 RepID=UPI001EF41904|nr:MULTISPECIES: hypothetical protein [unclassified Epibacterium]MCG7622844.1 hypothetical protein [Epibacterium sp. Ofav1-8]MCG7627657.1 hypothetical protein [Epibacterium sp. MM17-32]